MSCWTPPATTPYGVALRAETSSPPSQDDRKRSRNDIIAGDTEEVPLHASTALSSSVRTYLDQMLQKRLQLLSAVPSHFSSSFVSCVKQEAVEETVPPPQTVLAPHGASGVADVLRALSRDLNSQPGPDGSQRLVKLEAQEEGVPPLARVLPVSSPPERDGVDPMICENDIVDIAGFLPAINVAKHHVSLPSSLPSSSPMQHIRSNVADDTAVGAPSTAQTVDELVTVGTADAAAKTNRRDRPEVTSHFTQCYESVAKTPQQLEKEKSMICFQTTQRHAMQRKALGATLPEGKVDAGTDTTLSHGSSMKWPTREHHQFSSRLRRRRVPRQACQIAQVAEPIHNVVQLFARQLLPVQSIYDVFFQELMSDPSANCQPIEVARTPARTNIGASAAQVLQKELLDWVQEGHTTSNLQEASDNFDTPAELCIALDFSDFSAVDVPSHFSLSIIKNSRKRLLGVRKHIAPHLDVPHQTDTIVNHVTESVRFLESLDPMPVLNFVANHPCAYDACQRLASTYGGLFAHCAVAFLSALSFRLVATVGAEPFGIVERMRLHDPFVQKCCDAWARNAKGSAPLYGEALSYMISREDMYIANGLMTPVEAADIRFLFRLLKPVEAGLAALEDSSGSSLFTVCDVIGDALYYFEPCELDFNTSIESPFAVAHASFTQHLFSPALVCAAALCPRVRVPMLAEPTQSMISTCLQQCLSQALPPVAQPSNGSGSDTEEGRSSGSSTSVDTSSTDRRHDILKELSCLFHEGYRPPRRYPSHADDEDDAIVLPGDFTRHAPLPRRKTPYLDYLFQRLFSTPAVAVNCYQTWFRFLPSHMKVARISAGGSRTTAETQLLLHTFVEENRRDASRGSSIGDDNVEEYAAENAERVLSWCLQSWTRMEYVDKVNLGYVAANAKD